MPTQPPPDHPKPRSQSRKLPLITAFRLTETELAELRERAHSEGKTVANYLRGLVFQQTA